MPRRFEIVLNRPTRPARVCYPGEEVSGTVTIQSDKPAKRYRAVCISLLGRAEVSWQENRLYFSHELSNGKQHHASDDFLHLSATVWTSGPNGVTQLSAGRHDFPFHFVLPLNIPPTVNTDLGYVAYTLKATIKTGRFSINHIVKKVIEVAISPSSPVGTELFRPVHKRKRCQGCIFSCHKKLTILDVSLPKRAYAIGECLPVSISVLAEQARRAKFLLTAALIRKVSFSVKREVASEESRVSLVHICRGRDTMSNSTRRISWSPEGLAVPANTLPSTRACALVNISYLVRAVVTSRWRLGVCADIPIEIGLPCDPSSNTSAPPLCRNEAISI